MMNRLIIPMVLTFFISFLVKGQGEANNWYFGENAGLTFNGGAPAALIDGNLNTIEGCATISDAAGNLKFYTDGRTVYNRNHMTMPNGSGLQGNSSSSQSGLIVPHPGNPDLYYIFTLQSLAAPGGLRYSVVDITLDGGLGDVTAEKNVLLHDPTSEKITAVSHENGTDVWVISHKYNSDEFEVYLITATGINTTPVTSAVGFNLTVLTDTIGCMKASPDGTKIGVVYSDSEVLELLEFDPATGIISNPISINSFGTNASGFASEIYGIEFSPRSTYMYVTESVDGVYQFDVTNYSGAAINASKTFLGKVSSTSSTGANRALQLASDGRIYMAVDGATSLAAIDNPDNTPVPASFIPNAVSLNGRISRSGLPPFIQSYFDIGFLVEQVCEGDTTQFTANLSQPYTSILWDFGDGSTSTGENPGHIYAAAGSYDVVLTVVAASGQTFVEQQRITIYEQPVAQMIPVIELCDSDVNGVEQVNLRDYDNAIRGSLPPLGYTVNYYDSTTNLNAGIAISNPNSFTVDATTTVIAQISVLDSPGCSDTTTFSFDIITAPVVALDAVYNICDLQPLLLNLPTGFDSYQWSNGDTTSTTTITAPGTYSVTVGTIVNGILCTTTADFDVQQVSVTFNSIELVDWTVSDNSISVEVDGIGNFEYSIDGIHFQSSPVFTGLPAGNYEVIVRDDAGCNEIRQLVTLLNYPRYFTPNSDGYHDFWQLQNTTAEPDNEIFIYDRFGKLIKQLDPTGIGWDGTFNGAPLPASDYWFTVKRANGLIYKGHFSLIR